MNCRENQFTRHPHTPGRGVFLGDTISASSSKKYIGNAIILSDYNAKPGNQREGTGR